MNDIACIEFNWSKYSIYIELLGGAVAIIISVYIFPYAPILTFTFVALSVLAFLGFFLKRDSVYIEISQYFLIINPMRILDKPIQIEWKLLKGILKISKRLIILKHMRGKKIKIVLNSLNKQDRERVVGLIKEKLEIIQ